MSLEKYLIDYKGKPAQTKRKKTDEEKQAVKRKYEEEKRERLFQPRWLTVFDWLTHVEVNGQFKMFCVHCKGRYGCGTFATGSRNYKMDALRAHDRSDAHRDAVASVNAKKEGGVADKMLLSLNKREVEGLKVLFRTAHSLALHGRPFTDFGWLLDLQVANGLQVPMAYKNDKR